MSVVEFIGWFVIVAAGLVAGWFVLRLIVAVVLLRALSGPGGWNLKR